MDIDYVEIEEIKNELSNIKQRIHSLNKIQEKISNIEEFLMIYTKGNYERYLNMKNKNKK